MKPITGKKKSLLKYYISVYIYLRIYGEFDEGQEQV